jgi:hypothetical protein
VLTVLLIVLLLGPAPARAAEATMTFTGALSVVGLLSSITVRPSSVTVPAGGEVAFVNATSAVLTVNVGGKSTRVEPGGSASMLFTGADRAETFTVTATALNLPLVGALTSSVGRVAVQAVPAAPEHAAPQASAAPRSSVAPRSPAGTGQPGAGQPGAGQPGIGQPGIGQPGGGQPGTGESDAGEPERDPAQPGDPAGTDGTTQSGAVVPLRPSTSPRQGDSATAAAPGSSGDGDGSGPSGSEGNGGSRNGDDAGDGGRAAPDAKRADAEVEPVLPPFPGFSSTHDQLGLIFLLGAVVLAGLGAALFRTVLAFRPVVEVGAHSQAASRARKVRRRRS